MKEKKENSKCNPYTLRETLRAIYIFGATFSFRERSIFSELHWKTPKSTCILYIRNHYILRLRETLSDLHSRGYILILRAICIFGVHVFLPYTHSQSYWERFNTSDSEMNRETPWSTYVLCVYQRVHTQYSLGEIPSEVHSGGYILIPRAIYILGVRPFSGVHTVSELPERSIFLELHWDTLRAIYIVVATATRRYHGKP